MPCPVLLTGAGQPIKLGARRQVIRNVNLTWPGTSDQDTEIIIYTFIFAKNLLNGHSGAVGATAMWPDVPEPELLHERARVPARATVVIEIDDLW